MSTPPHPAPPASALRDRIRAELSLLWRRTLASRLVPRSKTPYATHLPVLIGIARLLAPRRLLELGGGLISTPALADRALFPTLESVHTLEDDPLWAEQIGRAVRPHHEVLVETTPAIPARIADMDLHPYDMIFIDNARLAAERARSIGTVLGRCAPATVVLIHDFEWRAYRRAVPLAWRRFTFNAWNPATGIVWQERLQPPQLRRLDRALKRGRDIALTDTAAWQAHLARELPAGGAA